MASQTESSDRWRRQCELFHAALERKSAERRAYLEQACASDLELRHEAEALLAAHAEAPSLLDHLAEMALDSQQDFAQSTATPKSLQLSDPVLSPGTVLAERFEIIRLLGRGGMGAVYEARDRELHSSVAVKILRPEIAKEGSVQERFRREIQLARQVTHPNVCRIYDLGLHGEDLLFLSMELLEGETLAARLQREGPWSPEAALPIVEQVAAALSEAHRVGVIHRDLKSANVMLVPEGEDVRAVVTDFGLAISKRAGEGKTEHLTRTGELLGTLAYMAPEQLEGGRTTPATDVYALGLLLYEMVTGELPFSSDTPISGALHRLKKKAPSPRHRAPELDRLWEHTILRCLERDPEERFRSPGEVVTALKGEAVPARWTPRRRRRWALGGGTAAALAVLAFLVGPQWFSPGSPTAVEALGFGERDWVLIAAFENRTGEDIFDGTLEAALGRELSNSRFVNVVPRERVGDTLKLMKKPLDSRLDTNLAREVALRDGGIRALLTGRVEKLGPTYVLSAELVDAGSGVTVAGLSEEARDQETILAAIRRLSSRVRESLGETLPLIRQSERKLEPMTTPSLKALHLFTQADRVIAGPNDRVAEELLRQAVAEDPDFASGYMHLAFAIRNQGRAKTEYLPYAERAFELADTTSDRERYFIRGGYYSMMGQMEESQTAYKALLQLHPDHFWANNNMVHQLAWEFARFEEAVPYAVQLAKIRPDDPDVLAVAARALAQWANRPAEAKPYIERATALLRQDDARTGSFNSVWLRFYPTHEHWVKNDPGRVLEDLSREETALNSLDGAARRQLTWFIADGFRNLGRIEKATELFGDTYYESYHCHLAATAFLRGDPGRAQEHLKRSFLGAPPPSRMEPLRIMLLARTSGIEAAQEALSDLEAAAQETRRVVPDSIFSILGGELALARNETEEGIRLLSAGLPVERALGSTIYFLGSDSLADALRKMGDSDRALRALEEASLQRSRVFPHAGSFWLRVQWRLAQLYRELGREAEAQAIEGELRELLAYADPDFWLVRELENLHRPATASAAA